MPSPDTGWFQRDEYKKFPQDFPGVWEFSAAIGDSVVKEQPPKHTILNSERRVVGIGGAARPVAASLLRAICYDQHGSRERGKPSNSVNPLHSQPRLFE